MSSVKIIHSCSDFVVAVKRAGVHSAPLQAGESSSALSCVAKDFPQILNVKGKKGVEGGLIHRIDYDTAGLLLFACNQDFYHHIIACQEAGLFRKKYFACCRFISQYPEILGGFPPSPISQDNITPSAKFTVSSAFRPFGPGRKQVRPVTEASGKFSRKKASGKKGASEQGSPEKGGGKAQVGASVYSTNFIIEKMEDKEILVQASLSKGYRHQVRCHLAWCSLPVMGDPIYYNSLSLSKKGEKSCCMHPSTQMQFFATGFSFPALDCSLKKSLSDREKSTSSPQIQSFSISPQEIVNI